MSLVAGKMEKKVAMTVSRCEYKCSVDQLCIELNSAFYVLRERWNFSEARLLEIESSILNETYRFSYPSLSTLSETRSAKHEPRVLWLGKSADVPYFSRSSSEDSLVSIALARVISKRLQSCLYYSDSSFGLRGGVDDRSFYGSLLSWGPCEMAYRLDLSPCLCDLWHNDLLEELDPVVSCGSIMRLISYFLSLSVEGGAASSCSSRKGLPLSLSLIHI